MLIRSQLRPQYNFVKDYVATNTQKTKSVKEYTGEAYESINKSLLYGSKLTVKDQIIVNDLDDIFRRIPALEDDIIVYRGVTKKHSFGVLSGFISTSYNLQTAITFADKQKQCCIFAIRVPAGAKILPVEDVSVNANEGEILLPRSGYFEVKGTVFKNGFETFNLDLILVAPEPPKIVSSPKKKSISREQILKLLTENTQQDEIDLFGVDEAVRNIAADLEKRVDIFIDEDVILEAIEILS